MAVVYICMLVVIVAFSLALMYLTRVRMLESAAQSHAPQPDSERYRPMLRLLAESDLNFGNSPALRRKLRSRRREMFRAYLRCLAKDYGRLLSGVRLVMVESGVDRPDLAKTLLRSRTLFAMTLCRIEVNLWLHALGIGKVDVSGLVDALDAMRTAMTVMTPATGAAF
jgi:hypothetical protein